MKRCGIINYWWSPRDGHGASLTAFALYHAVQELFEGEIEPVLIKTMYSPKQEECEKGRHFRFISQICNVTNENYINEYDFEKLSEMFDIILLGSDQVFRVDWIPKEWYLNDVGNKVKKIAVSASFGTGILKASNELIENAAKGLRKFHKISVREEDGIDIFHRHFDKFENVIRIIDPVYWFEKDFYTQIALNSNYKMKKNGKPDVFFCFLDWNSKVDKLGKQLADQGYNIYLDEPRVMGEDFLFLVNNADYVVTDSYHTMCYSIIFNKQFVGVYNQNRGTSRIEELKRMFHLNDVFIDIEESDNVNFQQIDYAAINKIITKEAEAAKEWLKNAILS